jgi:hypothetical protein
VRLPHPDKIRARNDREYSPSPQPSPSEGRGSKEGNIYSSTYIEPKKRSFYRVVGKKIVKNIYSSTYKEQKRCENAGY